MTHTEITEVARLIRPILASQLSLCRAVYPPTHPDATITASVERAIEAFDRLVQAASLQPATEDKQLDEQRQQTDTGRA